MTTFYGRKCMAVWIIVLLPYVSAMAQAPLTLQALIEASQKHLPLLQQKQSLLNSAEASLTDVRHSFLPQVKAGEQLNIGSDNSLSGSLFTYGITPSSSGGIRGNNTWQPVTGNVAVIYGEYELYNFGLNQAKTDYAKSVISIQQADLDKENYAVSLEVARLYLNILKNQYRLDADMQNIQRYNSIFTVIRALTASGLKAGADSSLAKAELSRTRINFNQTQGRLNQLREQLSYLTGIPPGSLMADTSSGRFKTRMLLPDYAVDTVNNPLLNLYSSRLQLYRSNEQLIRKNYMPRISLSASTWARGSSIQFNDQFKSLATGLGYQRFNYLAGITFTYNLLNGLYKKDKLAINRYQSEAGKYEWQQQKLALVSAARQADNTLEAVQANLGEMPVQLQSAEAAYQQKLAQYRAGIISLIDLTNATFVLYRSQTDYIETLSDWYLAQLEKAAASGNLTQFIQSIN